MCQLNGNVANRDWLQNLVCFQVVYYCMKTAYCLNTYYVFQPFFLSWKAYMSDSYSIHLSDKLLFFFVWLSCIVSLNIIKSTCKRISFKFRNMLDWKISFSADVLGLATSIGMLSVSTRRARTATWCALQMASKDVPDKRFLWNKLHLALWVNLPGL